MIGFVVHLYLINRRRVQDKAHDLDWQLTRGNGRSDPIEVSLTTDISA